MKLFGQFSRSTVLPFYRSKSGVATIPTIIALTLLILAIGIGISLLSFTEAIDSTAGSQASQAQSYAEAGARDALERIARNFNYSCTTTDCYSIDLVTNGCANNTGCARVSVSTGTGAAGSPKVITSKGQVNANVRKLQVSVYYDAALSGQITTSTWQDLNN